MEYEQSLVFTVFVDAKICSSILQTACVCQICLDLFFLLVLLRSDIEFAFDISLTSCMHLLGWVNVISSKESEPYIVGRRHSIGILLVILYFFFSLVSRWVLRLSLMAQFGFSTWSKKRNVVTILI